jgi:3-hydroxypropanoate dehydrogenase
VSDDQIQAIYHLIKWAPTSMNLQTLRIVHFRWPQARAKLVDPMADGNKAKTATAPLVAVLAADVNFHDELHRTFPHFPGTRDVFAGDDTAPEGVAKFNGALQLHRRRAHGVSDREHQAPGRGCLVRPAAETGLQRLVTVV